MSTSSASPRWVAIGRAVRDALVIGTVANFRAQKDYPTLLAAARLLVDRGVPFRLVAVGQGPLEREITDRRDELGLGDHVVLAGFRPDAVEVMAACDVFVLASAWEGLPVAAMEAAALGLPIVATSVGGIAEQFGPTDAVLVPPGDPVALAGALESVLTDPHRRAELSSAARLAAARFDIHRAMETLTARYEQLVGTPAWPPEPSPVPAHAAPRRDRAAAGDTRRPGRDPPLLRVSLGWDDAPRYRELFAWKHERNPFGPSLAWVVEHHGRVVAVRLFMRWEFRRGGTTVRAVRAVDTATHPDHQGRGLFTALTLHALEACRADGVAFVFNTPNVQSLPGYLKMGWREVGRPRTAVRAASPQRPRRRPPQPRPRGALVATDRRRFRHRLVARWWRPVAGTVARVVDRPDVANRVRRAVRALAIRPERPALSRRRRGGRGGRRAPPAPRSGRELVVAEQIGDPAHADRSGRRRAVTSGRHSCPAPRRIAPPSRLDGGAAGGPILTWRAVCDHGPPPLSNWDLRLGDLELF